MSTQPALTAEEWATARLWNAGKLPGGRVTGYGMYNPNARPEKKHALAALCLDGQPFGFTWDDVEHVQLVAGQCDALRLGDNHAAVLRNLADRIAALLPPRE